VAENAALVRRLWELFEARRWDDAKALLNPDFVAEWPHSLERMRGRDDFIELNRNYPEGWSIRVDRIVAQGDEVVSEITVTQGEATFHAASFFLVGAESSSGPASTGWSAGASPTRNAPGGRNRSATIRSRRVEPETAEKPQTARWTLPALRHFVQTLMRLGTPFTVARTRCTFGFHRLGARRCEWETCMPKNGVFPQMSHTEAMTDRW
jgi:hypothetical protein